VANQIMQVVIGLATILRIVPGRSCQRIVPKVARVVTITRVILINPVMAIAIEMLMAIILLEMIAARTKVIVEIVHGITIKTIAKVTVKTIAKTIIIPAAQRGQRRMRQVIGRVKIMATVIQMRLIGIRVAAGLAVV
jgi:hypothetical protein